MEQNMKEFLNDIIGDNPKVIKEIALAIQTQPSNKMVFYKGNSENGASGSIKR